jgi:WD40 repeat protein
MNGQRILSSSEDGTARIWDMNTGQQLSVLRGHLVAIRSVMWNADESLILTASDDSTARLWAQDQEETTRLDIDNLIKRAECQVNRGLTEEEIARFSVPTPLKFNFAQRQCPPVFPWERDRPATL